MFYIATDFESTQMVGAGDSIMEAYANLMTAAEMNLDFRECKFYKLNEKNSLNVEVVEKS